MAAEMFNSLTGYSVGIPAVQIVNDAGVIVGNVNTNYVVANSIFTDNLRYSNGQRYVSGANTQVMFNNNGNLGASPNLTYDNVTNFLEVTNLAVPGTTNLGDISQVSILGGINGFVLQTDGMGTLSWTAQSGGNGGGNGTPGGANSQVQFNNEGSFGGAHGFTYNTVTNILNVNTVQSNFIGNLNGVASTALVANVVSSNSQPNITSVGVLTSLGVSGPVQAISFEGDGGKLSNIASGNIVGPVPLSTNVSGNSQSNITSVGTLVSLNVSGNISSANINASNRASLGNVFITGNTSLSGNFSMNSGRLIANGNIDFHNATSVNLGDASHVNISGGFANQVLTTDGTGNLSWTDGGGGGNGTPGGSNTQVQFNYDGQFRGSQYFTFDNVNHIVQVGGNLVANSFQMGSGVYQWSSSSVYFATTVSMSPNQLLYSIPISQISGVEFEIIATDPVGQSRQFAKLSSVYYNGTVEFTEYASLFVNGGVGNFDVIFNPGTIIAAPSLDLLVTPSTSNHTTYKMLITQYAP